LAKVQDSALCTPMQEKKYVDDFGRMDNIKKLSWACTQMLNISCAPNPAPVAPVKKVANAGTDGKYPVCIPAGSKSQSWGPVTGPRPEGITVYANGQCVISEFAGNDDGFYQPYAGDGHEPVYKEAVNQMLKAGACVGMDCGKDNPKNKYLDQFFTEMNKRAGVKDYDYANVRIISLCLWAL
jgi:hypothetical protein